MFVEQNQENKKTWLVQKWSNGLRAVYTPTSDLSKEPLTITHGPVLKTGGLSEDTSSRVKSLLLSLRGSPTK